MSYQNPSIAINWPSVDGSAWGLWLSNSSNTVPTPGVPHTPEQVVDTLAAGATPQAMSIGPEAVYKAITFTVPSGNSAGVSILVWNPTLNSGKGAYQLWQTVAKGSSVTYSVGDDARLNGNSFQFEGTMSDTISYIYTP